MERAWVDDGPSGRIQIYEKTTHDIHHVVTQRHLILGGCTIAVVASLIGLCAGYFAHTEHSSCVRGRSVALFAVYDENPQVKEKILKLVDQDHFSHNIEVFNKQPYDDQAIVDVIRSEWRKSKLEEIMREPFTNPVAQQGDQPNTVQIIYANGTQSETRLEMSKEQYAFVAFTINRTIQGNLTYASKLDRRDFHYLLKENVGNGTILLARYGVVPLREQITHAYTLGAIGVLLYMDPLDYATDYNEHALPRVCAPHLGQQHDIIAHEHEFALDDYPNLASHVDFFDLPIQIISGNFARKLLAELDTEAKLKTDAAPVPARMRGGFQNVSYASGSSTSFTIRLTTHNKVTAENLTNVVGVIRGRVEPDRYVIVGAGRDPWSPSSLGGMAILQGLVHVFSQLVSDSWRPRRSIVFVSFAAEHMNSAGLNHLLRSRMNMLRGRAVAYIDVTNPVLGTSSILATGSPLLSQALYNASSLVMSANSNSMDPKGAPSLYSEWLQNFPQQKPMKSAADIFKAAQDATRLVGTAGAVEDFLLEPNNFGPNGTRGLFNNYLHSAVLAHQPTIRLLDHTDGFSPFLTQAGIPVIQ
ncbi:N-acetylated-alpha-linked acidic dipeptidase 2-like, partial [Tropilaelaps mercedesae]